MTCFTAKRKSTAYVDGRLREQDRSRVTRHLRDCDPCASYFDQIACLRSGLQSLPAPEAPLNLKTQLRVIASREQHTLLETRGSRIEYLWTKWRFRINQLMRPLTIPATGGLLSSTRVVAYDVPVVYEDRVGANLVPMSVHSSVFFNISLDGHGHIQDYLIRDAYDQFTGEGGALVAHDIALPNFPSRAVGGDISILVTPIVYRQ